MGILIDLIHTYILHIYETKSNDTHSVKSTAMLKQHNSNKFHFILSKRAKFLSYQKRFSLNLKGSHDIYLSYVVEASLKKESYFLQCRISTYFYII